MGLLSAVLVALLAVVATKLPLLAFRRLWVCTLPEHRLSLICHPRLQLYIGAAPARERLSGKE